MCVHVANLLLTGNAHGRHVTQAAQGGEDLSLAWLRWWFHPISCATYTLVMVKVYML